jgi:hypothetical protein
VLLLYTLIIFLPFSFTLFTDHYKFRQLGVATQGVKAQGTELIFTRLNLLTALSAKASHDRHKTQTAWSSTLCPWADGSLMPMGTAWSSRLCLIGAIISGRAQWAPCGVQYSAESAPAISLKNAW